MSECRNCGGTHYGSGLCPFLPEEIEENKRLADEGFWRKRRDEMNGVQVWLWKNGDHYLGYTHLYPCDGNGDPLVLGEPVGKVVIKSSLPRDLFTNGLGFNNANTPMPQAPAAFQEAPQAAEAELEANGETEKV